MIDKQRILIFRTGRLGDFLVSIPAIRMIRVSYPHAHIVLLTCASTKRTQLTTTQKYADKRAILPWLPFVYPDLVDEVVDFTWIQKVQSYLEIRKRIAGQFDRIYVLPYSGELLRSRVKKWLFLRALGARGKIFGSKERKAGQHQVEAAIDAVLEDRLATKNRTPEFTLSISDAADKWAENEWAERNLGGKRVIAVFPGGTFSHKKWPLSSFAQLCQELVIQKRCTIIFVGSESEKAFGDTIMEHLPGSHWSSGGQLDLMRLAAILKRCVLFVGNDSGPGHLAAALGVRCVTLMSAVHTKGIWEPWGAQNIALRHDVSCSPCGSETFCPLNTQECIRGIQVREVITACTSALLTK